jgi:hypothetical protein
LLRRARRHQECGPVLQVNAGQSGLIYRWDIRR